MENPDRGNALHFMRQNKSLRKRNNYKIIRCLHLGDGGRAAAILQPGKRWLGAKSNSKTEINSTLVGSRDTRGRIARVCRSSTAWAESCGLSIENHPGLPCRDCSRWCKSP